MKPQSRPFVRTILSGLCACSFFAAPSSAAPDVCTPQPAAPRAEISGTSLGDDNISIPYNNGSPNIPDITWTGYSGSETCGWATSVSMVVDGNADGWSTTIPNASGALSGCPNSDPLLLPPGRNLFKEPCKHTLRVVGEAYLGSNCTGPTVHVESNPIVFWVDNPNTTPVENMPLCTGGAPMSDGDVCGKAPEVGRPVNLANGKMYHQMVDLRIQGPMPIEFSRRFDSTSTYDGVMGYGWQHGFMVRLSGPGGSNTTKFLTDRTMRTIPFNCLHGDSNLGHCLGEWESDTVDHLMLSEEAVGVEPHWHVADKHKTTWDFNVDGQLMKITDRNGNTTTLTYTGSPSQLTSIADGFGRSLVLTYSGTRISQISGGGRTVKYTYDTSGNLTVVKHSDPTITDKVFVTYDYGTAGHRLMTATDANNHSIEEHTYTGALVTDTQAADGNDAYHIQYGYPTATQTTVTNARVPAVTTTFTIDLEKGVATDRTGGPGCPSCGDAGDRTQKSYDSRLNVTDVVDGLDVVTHMTYDGQGNVLTRIEAATSGSPRTTTYTYDSDFNFPLSVSIPTVGTGACATSHANRLTSMSYDSNGNLLTEQTTGCNGSVAFDHTTIFTHDSHGQITSVNGPRDDSTDVLDKTTYEYYPDTGGGVSVNDRGRLKKITNALGHETTFAEYDLFGNVGSVTDANLVEIRSLYDFMDHVVARRVVAPSTDDIVTIYGYDDVGNLTSVRLPNCFAIGAGCAYSLQYGYDTVNRLSEVVDPFGNKVLYTYDKVGNRTREEYKDASSALKRFTNFTYDDFNRLKYAYFSDTATPESPDAVFFKYTYFADGMRHTEQDPEGHVSTLAYDDLKRLTSVTQAAGSDTPTTAYGYDVQDNLTSVTDPNDLQTIYTNGDTGWRLTTESPDTGTTTYAYDPAGNLLTTHDANNITVTRAYDALNRPTTVTYPNTALNVTNTYDSTSVSFGIGRRTRSAVGPTSAPTQVSTFGYDRRGLLTTEQKTIGGLTYATGYDYDPSGNLVELRYPTSDATIRQGRVDYSYDAAERVSQISTVVNGTTPTVADTFAYMPFGPRSAMHLGNSLTDTRTFDTRYQLDTWTLGSILDYTHTFNSDGNLVSRLDNVDTSHANDRTYVYDAIHRLTGATGPWTEQSTCDGSATYVYDQNGNRTCKGETGTSTMYSYTSGTNRLASSSGGEVASYTNDSNGNTTGDGTHTYQYSQADRLAMVDNGATATYTYDGDNRRAIKSIPGTTTYYFYDPAGRLLTELVPGTQGGVGNGKDYLYVHDAPVARVDWSVTEQDLGNFLRADKSSPNVHLDWSSYTPSGDTFVVRRKQVVNPNDKTFNGAAAIATIVSSPKTYDDPVLNDGNRYDYSVLKQLKSDALFYYHTDHLGTPIVVTDGSGAPVWRAEQFPFGGLYSNTIATVENNLRFPGQYFDSETGLHQNWFRDYSPKTGRYFEADPAGLGAGPEPYSYARENPISLADRTGLWPYLFVPGTEWCGPNWTGGAFEEYTPKHDGYYSLPINDFDNTCRTHDLCYWRCRQDSPCDEKARGECMTECDRALADKWAELEIAHPTMLARISAKVMPSTPVPPWTGSLLWWWMQNNSSPEVGNNGRECRPCVKP